MISRSLNSVSTLGTLHDTFLSNPQYGLKEFVSALYQFKPDAIFSEVLPQNPTAADASIDGGIEQALVYAYAQAHSIPVIPTDWFDETFIREMESEGQALTPEAITTLTQMSAYRQGFSSASLLDLNSPETKKIVREIYRTYEELGLMASRKRNDRIWENIKKELKGLQNKKILIVYGMDHKYFIDDQLLQLPDVTTLEVSSWYNNENAKSFIVPEAIKRESILNLQRSAAALTDRLNSPNYSPAFKLRLQSKEARFTQWAQAISLL